MQGLQAPLVCWSVVHHEVLGLPGCVAGNRDDSAGGSALDQTCVLLDKAFVAVVASELELALLTQLAGAEHEFSEFLCAMQCAFYRRALPGRVVGKVTHLQRPQSTMDGR